MSKLVPGSMILIAAATIIAQNVYRALVPAASDRTVGILARALVPLIALAAVLMALRGGQAIVVLLLMGYNFVTQLFPALLLSFGTRPKISAAAAFAGILAGELTVAWETVAGASIATLVPSAPQFMKDLNIGIVALLVNIVVLALVALATCRPMQILPVQEPVSAA